MKKWKQLQQNNSDLVVSSYPTQQQQVWAAVAVGAAGIVAGAVESSDASRKASHAAADAARAGKVDIQGVSDLAQEQALKNAQVSQQLEQQLTPGVYNLKTNSINDVLNALGPNAYTTTAGNLLLNQANSTPTTYTTATPGSLQSAANSAQQLLQSGNTLPTARLPIDVQNQVTRGALANAGTTSPGGLQLGRDLTARDLGLTSLQLGQQAQQNLLNQIAAAQSTGTALGQFGYNQNQQLINQSQFNRNQQLQQAAALQALSSGDFAKYLSAAQLGQSIQSPVVGLDPGSIAGLAVGNGNMAANAGQQQAAFTAQQGNNYAQLLGQLGGVGAGAIKSYNSGGNSGYNTALPANTTSAGGGYDFNNSLYSGAGACYVARMVYGVENPAWQEFRAWMLENMPGDFIDFYIQNGKDIASSIRGDELTKRFIRGLMDELKKRK